MKHIVLVMIFALCSLALAAQERVNIELVNTPSDQPCQILLWPQQLDSAVLSNVVFTLKWKIGHQSALGGVLRSPIPLSPVGASIDVGRFSYRTYTGIGMDSVQFDPQLPLAILIDKRGADQLAIATDDFLELPAFNARYYVSVGGRDVTGVVVEPAASNDDHINGSGAPTMYYDQESHQMLIERGGIFRTLLGQPVIVTNKSVLRLVR